MITDAKQSSASAFSKKGMFSHYRGFSKNPLLFCEKARHYEGDFYSFRLLSKKIHILSSPYAAQHVLVDRHEAYGRGTTKILKPIIGKGLLTSQGKTWQKRRQLVQPFFHPREIGRLRDVFIAQIDRALHEWDKSGDNVRCIAPFMQRLTLSVVSRSFLKKDAWNIDPRVLHAMDHLYKIVHRRMNRPIDWPLWLPTPENRAFQSNLAVLDEAVQEIIDSARSGEAKQDSGDLIDRIISAKDPLSGQTLTAKNIRDEVMTFFLAGHETTSALLTFLLDFLSRHPHVQDALREELLSLPSDYPLMRDLSRLKLLYGTILETLRLRPSAWSIFRIAREDDLIPGCGQSELSVKSGDIILVSVWNLHHHQDYWQQPKAFDPYRMEKLATQPKGSYLPFGIGDHSCIGNNFAIFEVSLILSKLLRNYRLEAVSPHPLPFIGGITLRPQGDLPLRFSKV